MLISKEYQFIFIHIYKNAGTSITNALRPFAASQWKNQVSRILNRFHISTQFGPQPFPDHSTALDLIKAMGKENFKSYFSFAIVRNPWDWQVSLYKYMLKNTAHHQHELAKSFGSFDNYIKWRCAEEVRFQKDFIYSEDGELLVDYVGKFETIDADFQKICSQIGISASLPKLNVSNSKPYRDYYTKETEELVRKTFHTDITLFKYDF